MLPAEHRMRVAADFRATTRRGSGTARGAAGGLVVHLSTTGPVSAALTGLPLTGLPRPVLVGFVVPKAVGNAVVRNRVRRRLRALLATRLATLPPQASVVVRVTPAAAHASTATLAADLDVGLGRAVAGVRRSGAAAP